MFHNKVSLQNVWKAPPSVDADVYSPLRTLLVVCSQELFPSSCTIVKKEWEMELLKWQRGGSPEFPLTYTPLNQRALGSYRGMVWERVGEPKAETLPLSWSAGNCFLPSLLSHFCFSLFQYLYILSCVPSFSLT